MVQSGAEVCRCMTDERKTHLISTNPDALICLFFALIETGMVKNALPSACRKATMAGTYARKASKTHVFSLKVGSDCGSGWRPGTCEGGGLRVLGFALPGVHTGCVSTFCKPMFRPRFWMASICSLAGWLHDLASDRFLVMFLPLRERRVFALVGRLLWLRRVGEQGPKSRAFIARRVGRQVIVNNLWIIFSRRSGRLLIQILASGESPDENCESQFGKFPLIGRCTFCRVSCLAG